MTALRAATRGSALALWQTHHVADLLGSLGVDGLSVEPVVVSTTGDERQDVPIHAIGGKGVFVKQVQAEVLAGRADLAVHSAKDLPSGTPDGLVLASVPARGNPLDALVGCALADLRPGASVATGSIRRRVQLQALRPDLIFHELRGNIATRLEKAQGFDAVVMAAAALERLGEDPGVVDVLPADIMLPQVAQGSLAIECRADDHATLELLRRIQHGPTRRVFDAERAFLDELGGDCDLPVGAHGQLVDDHIRLRSLVAAPDASAALHDDRSGPDGEALGRAAARELMDDRGGRELLGR